MRQPHRVILRNKAVVLSFFTAQAADLARQANEAEREGKDWRARDLWALARDTAPADAFTKSYCSEHAEARAA